MLESECHWWRWLICEQKNARLPVIEFKFELRLYIYINGVDYWLGKEACHAWTHGRASWLVILKTRNHWWSTYKGKVGWYVMGTSRKSQRRKNLLHIYISFICSHTVTPNDINHLMTRQKVTWMSTGKLLMSYLFNAPMVLVGGLGEGDQSIAKISCGCIVQQGIYISAQA